MITDRFIDGSDAVLGEPVYVVTDEEIAAVRRICAAHDALDLLPMILGKERAA